MPFSSLMKSLPTPPPENNIVCFRMQTKNITIKKCIPTLQVDNDPHFSQEEAHWYSNLQQTSSPSLLCTSNSTFWLIYTGLHSTSDIRRRSLFSGPPQGLHVFSIFKISFKVPLSQWIAPLQRCRLLCHHGNGTAGGRVFVGAGQKCGTALIGVRVCEKPHFPLHLMGEHLRSVFPNAVHHSLYV